jgi:protein ImuB
VLTALAQTIDLGNHFGWQKYQTMAFASIYVPQFMVQAVLRTEPQLRAGALALVDGTPPLVRVIDANDSAWRAGIQMGMAKSQVAQFLGVEIRNRSQSKEAAAHAALLDLGWSVSPRMENTAADTIVLDLAGLNSLFGSDEEIAGDLSRRALSLGLATNVAVAANIEVAIHAARGFTGVTVIPDGEESRRIGVLPVHVLFPSEESLATLDRWGIKTCGDLAALPLLELSERLGQEGVRLHELARGASVRSLVLAEPSLSFREELELDTAEEELEPVSFLLGRLLDQLCARLQARAQAATAIHLRFDLGDLFEKDAEIIKRNSPPDDNQKIYRKVLTLPVAMRDSKMLLKLLRLQLQSDPPPGSIVKIILVAEPSRRRAAQSGLFVPSSPDPEKLELTVARLAKLVGSANVGSPELVDTHRPGEFRMSRFRPPANEEPPRRKSKNGTELAIAEPAANESPSRRSSVGFRMFRPRLPATIELHDGIPSRVFFRGVYGSVIAVSGPWRTSGDWWREDSWLQDEWDIEVWVNSPSARIIHTRNSFSALDSNPQQQTAAPSGTYCIYFDVTAQSWFVRGMYD